MESWAPAGANENSPDPKDDAYILEFPGAPHTNGRNRYVNWVHGCGVLDRRAIAEVRPDLVDGETLELLADYDVLAEAARYWGDRGAEVQKVTAAKALKYRQRIEQDPESFDPSTAETISVGDLMALGDFNFKVAQTLLAEKGISVKKKKDEVPAADGRAALGIGPPIVDPEE
jgi:hypothetical protein